MEMKENLRRWLLKEKAVKISFNKVCKKAASGGGDTRYGAMYPSVLVTSAPRTKVL